MCAVRVYLVVDVALVLGEGSVVAVVVCGLGRRGWSVMDAAITSLQR